MEYVLGGLASCGAVLFSNPLDVVKTRIQLQGELKAKGQYHVTYRNVFHAFYTIGRIDGVRGLQKGLTPALVYQFSLNSIRRGVYAAILNSNLVRSENDDGKVSLLRTAFAGALAGTVASAIASPSMMIKTHFQSRANAAIAVGYQHNHENFRQAVRSIYSEFGIKGLWRGANGLIIRVTAGSSVELATFAVAKDIMHRAGIFEDGTFMNSLSGSILSGVCIVFAMQPFDVIAVRLFNQGTDIKGKGLYYRNWLDCVYKIWYTEGPLGFYKGVSAMFFRLFPHTVLSLVFWDELRLLFNIYSADQKDISIPVTSSHWIRTLEELSEYHVSHHEEYEMEWGPF